MSLGLRLSGSSQSLEIEGVTRITSTDSSFIAGKVGLNLVQEFLAGIHVKASLVKVSREKAYRKAQTLLTPPSGQVWKSYYFSGSVRIAMRVQVNGVADQVYYLLADHLGSTTVSYRADGQDTRFQSYRPWGELRGSGNSLPTDRTYTGQRWSATIGLSYFNARWFDSSLGRFAQADSVIPGGVQGLDRYAFVNNNPLKYIDPSGNNPECGPDGIYCSNNFEEAFGISFEGDDWSRRNKAVVRAGIRAVANRFAMELEIGNIAMAFSVVFQDGITFAWVSSYTDSKGDVYTSGAITKSSSRIEVASLSQPTKYRSHEMALTNAMNNIVHEIGHAFAQLWWVDADTYDQSGPYGNQNPIPADYLNNGGFYLYPEPKSAKRTWRQHPCNAGDSGCSNETFADMFLGWTFNKWANDPERIGDWRANYMTTNMAEWVVAATRR